MQSNRNNALPIGVFDSGLGGLTVVRALSKLLPEENIIYLGDSARVPYGTRSADTVIRYAQSCSKFLVSQGLKLLVVACNTASAVALGALRQQVDVPVLGVITAGALAATSQMKARRIGVIGTAGTIGSGAYIQAIGAVCPDCEVYQQAAPLFVPLAEEGWTEGDVPLLAAKRYLAPLVEKKIQALLLGCTHYPLLTDTIQSALRQLGSEAAIVDSASAMASQVQQTLQQHNLGHQMGKEGQLRFFVTDMPSSFEEVASRFLGAKLSDVHQVDI